MHVLFICTGNIFRSMTAEYSLRAALGANSDIVVSSAGTIEAPHPIVPFVRDYLQAINIDISAHRPTIITREILAQADHAIAMDHAHVHTIAERFGNTLPLFSQFAYGKDLPMPDVDEVVPDWRNNHNEAIAYGHQVLDFICEAAPAIAKNLANER
jgi:protein-tyrosine phosphatase